MSNQSSIIRARDAVHYNAVIAEAAEGLIAELTDEEIIKWVTGIGKQHRFHENRFRRALEKLEAREQEADETSEPVEPTIAEQQAQFAAEFAAEQKEVEA